MSATCGQCGTHIVGIGWADQQLAQYLFTLIRSAKRQYTNPPPAGYFCPTDGAPWSSEAKHHLNCGFCRKKQTYAQATQKPRSQHVGTTMPPQIKCRIWWDVAVAAYRISVPYHEGFIEVLKATVPAGKRAFDPSTKIWTFEEMFLPIILTAAKAVWGDGELNVVTRDQTATNLPATASSSPLAAVAEQFVRALPYEAAKKAYQLAALTLHPDKPTGNAEKMSALNVAWSRIEKELYGK